MQLGTHNAAIPSVVHLREDGEVLAGEAAERRGLTEPTRLAREFKRRLGDPVPLMLGGTPYSVESLFGHLLRAVVEKVSELQGSEPDSIVVTHPASYAMFKADLMRQAVELAGLPEARLLAEPVAAALYYASLERVDDGAVIATYDLGGGTFDAALLRKEGTGFALLGRPQGIERLGGVDFDQAIFSHVVNSLEVEPGVLDSGTAAGRNALTRLRDECSAAKEALSNDTQATVPVMLPGIHSEVLITRREFESMIGPRLRETVQCLERTVQSAGLSMADIDRILLVGGSSRIPLVGQMVREATGRPVTVDAHPKHAIALGAALYAGATALSPREQASLTPDPALIAPAAERPREPAPGQPASPTGGGIRGRSKWALAASGVAAAGILAALLLFVAGGRDSARAAQIEEIAVRGNWYSVAFNTNGLAPSASGDRLVFYWQGTNPGSGIAYWGSSPFERLAAGSAPAGASGICVAVLRANGALDTSQGNCRGLP